MNIKSGLTLLLAIAFEVMGTVCMKFSSGFTQLWPSLLMLVFYLASFIAFVLCIKRIQISIAYALWTALGMLAITLIEIFILKEVLVTWPIILSLLLITIGVVGLTQNEESSV